MRYGDGLYFSSVSGKANDYAELSEKVNPFFRKPIGPYDKQLGHGRRGRRVDATVFPPKSPFMTRPAVELHFICSPCPICRNHANPTPLRPHAVPFCCRYPRCVYHPPPWVWQYFPQMTPAGKAVRCMFMADVAVANVFRTSEYRIDPDNQRYPPPGYDAVLGEVRGIFSVATAVSLKKYCRLWFGLFFTFFCLFSSVCFRSR